MEFELYCSGQVGSLGRRISSFSYNSKKMNCIGALSFLRSIYTFFDLSVNERSNRSSEFKHAGAFKRSKMRVVLRGEFFQTTFEFKKINFKIFGS